MKTIGIFVAVVIVIGILFGGYLLFIQKQPAKYTGPVEKINFSTSPDVKNAPIIIAMSKGYFQEEGLEVNFREIQSAKQAFLNMMKGEGVDISAVAEVPAVATSFDSKDFYFLATIVYSYDDKVIANKNKGVNVIADLKDKKIGVSGKGTSTHFFLSTLASVNRFEETELEIIFMAPNELTIALENGTLDAVVLWEPLASKAEQLLQNKSVVFPNEKIYRKTYNLMVKKDFARDHPETLEKFLRAINKANGFIEKNREESILLVAEIVKIDKKELTKIWNENYYSLSLDQSLLLTLEDEARWTIKNNLTNATTVPNYLDYIYTDALEKVKPEAVTIIR